MREQGIDQWQTGYPDYACIENDIVHQKGFFIVENEDILGYICVDYNGESAYTNIQGTWNTSENDVVVHRMAFTDKARGKGISDIVFRLVEELSREKA